MCLGRMPPFTGTVMNGMPVSMQHLSLDLLRIQYGHLTKMFIATVGNAITGAFLYLYPCWAGTTMEMVQPLVGLMWTMRAFV